MTREDFDAEESNSDSDEVRRLLAAAAEPVTMPPEVSARLDDVLTGLVADRATSDDVDNAPVIDMAQRRKSRWPKVLIAAAVVSVLGVGLGNVLNQTGSTMSADSASSADAGDTGALGGAESARSPSGSQEPKTSTDERGAAPNEDGSLSGGRPPRLSSASLTVDAQRIADASLRPAYADAFTPASSRCRLPSTSKGDVTMAVRLDGERATLVFRAEQDDRRLTEIFSCHDAESPVRTTTVDAR